MNKTKEEIREEVTDRLAMTLGINIYEEGSIAIAIVDSVIDEIYLLYKELEHIRNQAYLSTSQGYFTELIANLVDTERKEMESDSNLKLRASTSVQRHAKGNKGAIEQTILSVPGVAEMDYRTYGMGTGSFIVYIYPQEGYNQLRVLDDVELALRDVVSDGIYYEVRQPKETRIDISIVLQFDAHISQIEKQVVQSKVRAEVRHYINSLQRNDVFYINEVVQRVMQVSDHLMDIEIMGLFVDGVQRQVANTFPANDELFVPGEVSIS